jgi:uncharacterized protein (TIGR00369 family)
VKHSKERGDFLSNPSNDKEIPNYWPGNCFACSQTNMKGLQLRFWLSEKGCYTKCIIPDHLCGLDGVVHGGIIATLLDEVGAWTILSRFAQLGVTSELSIRYLKPVPTATELIVEGRIISLNEKNAIVHATLHSGKGKLLAEGESKWTFPKLSSMANKAGIDELKLQQFLDRYAPKDSL